MTYSASNIDVTLKCELKSFSNSLKMAPFDRSHTSSYSSSIVNMAVSCIVFKTRGVAAGFGHHRMPPPGCNNIAAILLMLWATLLPILIILRLFVLELWAGRSDTPCDLVTLTFDLGGHGGG